jgi:hypothetical protein
VTLCGETVSPPKWPFRYGSAARIAHFLARLAALLALLGAELAETRGVDEDSPLDLAYRTDSEHLIADRLPFTAALCLALVGASGIFEYLLYADHWRVFLTTYPIQVAVYVPLLVWRRELLRRGWLDVVNAATWATMAVLIHIYGRLAGLPPELTLLATICLLTGTSLLLPWGVRGQGVLVATSLIATATMLATAPSSAVPAPYLFFVAAAASAVSLFGAYYLDLYRFTIFCEATRREGSGDRPEPVAIARGINDSLDAVDVLDASPTRSAAPRELERHHPARRQRRHSSSAALAAYPRRSSACEASRSTPAPSRSSTACSPSATCRSPRRMPRARKRSGSSAGRRARCSAPR